jgi:hypothetical protein
MDIRSKFRTRVQEQWEDAFGTLIPDRWLFRARLRLVLLKDWKKGRGRGRAPFGANELR